MTNKIYVANFGYDFHIGKYEVTEIDGATNATTSIVVGVGPYAIAVNPQTNKIYVADSRNGSNTNDVTVIDGATNGTVDIPVGMVPEPIAVNVATNKIYVGGLRRWNSESHRWDHQRDQHGDGWDRTDCSRDRLRDRPSLRSRLW